MAREWSYTEMIQRKGEKKMATKVHHKYKVGQVIHCASNFTAWDIHGDKWDVGPLTGTIMRKVRRNNRPAYSVELVKGSNPIWPKTIVVTQQMITAGDIEINEPWVPDPIFDKDCSSESRVMEEPPVPEEESFPRKEQIVFLLGSEVEKLHSEIAKLTERETKLLSLLEIVKKL